MQYEVIADFLNSKEYKESDINDEIKKYMNKMKARTGQGITTTATNTKTSLGSRIALGYSMFVLFQLAKLSSQIWKIIGMMKT